MTTALELEQRLSAILEASPDAIIEKSFDGIVLGWSPGAERIYGYPAVEIVGRPFSRLVPPARSAEMRQMIDRVKRGERIEAYETERRRKDGKQIPIQLNLAPILDSDGQPVRIAIVARDITDDERMRADLFVQSSALAAAANAIAITDSRGLVVWVNPSFTKLTGYDREEVIGKNPRILKSGRQEPAFYENMWKTILAGNVWSGEVTNRRKDATLYVEEMTITPVRQKGAITHFIAIKQDVTDRRAAEDALRESEHLLDGLFNATPAAILILDREFRYLRVNQHLAELNGLAADAHLGRRVRDVAPTFAPLVEPVFRKVLADGKPATVELHADPPSTAGIRRHWVMGAFPIPGADGQPSAIAAVVTDVTEAKEAEQKLRSALAIAQQADRLKSAFLANMSHEVRTPLNIILGYNELIADRLTALHDEEVDCGIEAIARAADRLLQTIQGIIDLSRLETGTFELHPQSLALVPLVEEAIRGVRPSADKKQLSIRCELAVASADIFADEYSVKHAIRHLLTNAVKFTDKGGVVVRLERDANGGLSLSIADTGVGIDDRYLPHLFESFSQCDVGTTRRYEGSGIGLALVKRYLQANHAEISFRTEAGKGTTFRIQFPADTHDSRPEEARGADGNC